MEKKTGLAAKNLENYNLHSDPIESTWPNCGDDLIMADLCFDLIDVTFLCSRAV